MGTNGRSRSTLVHVATSATRRARHRVFGRSVALVVTVLVVIAACAADGGPSREFSAEAQEGRRLYNSQGCSGCHGRDGAGGVGPSFVGLYQSERELTDGRTVIADEDYLVRAIVDPRAEIVAGYSLPMPTNRLDEAEVAAVVAFIKELEPTP